MATKNTKTTRRVLPDLQAQKRIAELEAQVAALNAAQETSLKLKVSPKGAISVYGLGRWPVTLYRSQMERFIDPENVKAIQAFIEANEKQLAVKK